MAFFDGHSVVFDFVEVLKDGVELPGLLVCHGHADRSHGGAVVFEEHGGLLAIEVEVVARSVALGGGKNFGLI